MATITLTFPGLNTPVEVGGTAAFQPAWYYVLQALVNRTGGQSGVDVVVVEETADNAELLAFLDQPVRGNSKPLPLTVSVGASPFTWVAPFAGLAVITGGTVSALAITRDGTNFTALAGTSANVPVEQGDAVKITHTGAPTMTFLARAL